MGPIKAPRRSLSIEYSSGFPAAFPRVALEPAIDESYAAVLGAHVNDDGTACYVTAEAWRPEDTVLTVLNLMDNWWWNFYWLVIEGRGWASWPDDGSKAQL